MHEKMPQTPGPSVSFVPSGSQSATLPVFSKSYSTPGRDEQSTSLDQRRRHQTASTDSQQRMQRNLTRAQSIREQVSQGAATFFGVPPPTPAPEPGTPGSVCVVSEQEVKRDAKWAARRLRHVNRRYGRVKEVPVEQRVVTPTGDVEFTDSVLAQLPSPSREMSAPGYATAPPPSSASSSRFQPPSFTSTLSAVPGTPSREMSAKVHLLERRDSVAKMCVDAMTNLVTRGTLRPPPKTLSSTLRNRSNRLRSSSFTPGSLADDEDFDRSPDIVSSSDGAQYLPSIYGPRVVESIPLECIHEEIHSRKNSEVPFASRAVSVDDVDVFDDHDAADTRVMIHYADSGETMVGPRPPAAQYDHTPGSPTQERMATFIPAADYQRDDTAETALSSIVDEVFFDESDAPPIPPHGRGVAVHFHKIRPNDLPSHHYHELTFAQRQQQQQQMQFGDVEAGQDDVITRMSRPQLRVITRPVPPPHAVVDRDSTTQLQAQIRPSALFLDNTRPRRRLSRPGFAPPTERTMQIPDRPIIVRQRQHPLAQLEQQPLPPALAAQRLNMRRLKRQQQVREADQPPSAAASSATESKTFAQMLASLFTKSGRRRIGEGGFVGRLLGMKFKKDLHEDVLRQLDDYDDYRPYFSYWATTVQIIVCIVAIALYGFGPVGFGRREHSSEVLQPSLTVSTIKYYEQENFWLGPAFRNLVLLGAKFSPCMRRDDQIYDEIEKGRTKEEQTGCCIYQDKSACFQATREDCSDLLATLHKWSPENPSPDRQISGTVACQQPASVKPYEWPDKITEWPICERSDNHSTYDEMRCEISGYPCCVGIRGECVIATSEFCEYVNGRFHPEARLCSQVSCLEETCGMLPYLRRDRPDQFYRLFTSLFLHAGLLQLMITIVVQYIFMRDLEKLIGWHRMAIIYLLSGIGGNLAAAIFVPYVAEAGPAASHFGLLAALFVDAIYSWQMLATPSDAIIQLGS